MNDAAASTGFRVGRVALVVAGAMFMQNLDSAIINTSLPQMAQSFGVRPADLSLGITAYLLATAAFLPLASWLADRFGARRIFALAIAVFTLSSIACGGAHTLWQFVLARVLQGFGAAMMTPVGQTIVLRRTAPAELVRAVALFTWPSLLAPVIAPVLGGFLTTWFSWRWNFLINGPLGVLALLMVHWFVPATPPEPRRAFDTRGLLLSSGGLLTLLYGLESLAAGHSGTPAALAWIGSGTVLCVLAVRHLRRAAHPLLDLASLHIQTFRLATADAGSAFRMTIAATPFLLPLLLQLAYGLTPLAAGSYLMIYFCGNVAMKPFTTRLLQRFGFRLLLVRNGLLSAIVIAALAWPELNRWPWLVGALLFAAGLTRSMQFTCLNTLGFADVPNTGRGAASNLSSMLQQLANTAGVAIAALLLQKLPLLHGATAPAVIDFRAVFAVFGLLGVAAALTFRRLAPEAGAAVSGHRGAVAQ